MDPYTLPEGIVAWIEEVTGGTVEHLDRRPGGARKEAWFVDRRGHITEGSSSRLKIKDGGVGTTQIASQAVTSAKIADAVKAQSAALVARWRRESIAPPRSGSWGAAAPTSPR